MDIKQEISEWWQRRSDQQKEREQKLKELEMLAKQTILEEQAQKLLHNKQTILDMTGSSFLEKHVIDAQAKKRAKRIQKHLDQNPDYEALIDQQIKNSQKRKKNRSKDRDFER